MQIAHFKHATGSIISVAVSVLALTSCAVQDPDEDQESDELVAALPTLQVCNGGQFVCKSHVRVDEQGRITPNATPAGLGPADLASAYKLNPAITSTATIAIVDAFHYANAE